MQPLDKQYKYTIDKSKLQLFFDLSIDINSRSDILKEVEKVIVVVIVKHFSSGYEDLSEDFKSIAWHAAFSRRHSGRFNHDMSAYNYLYTLFRNEIGNAIHKYTREQVSDIGSLLKDAICPETKAEFPPEIEPFLELFSTGDFTIQRISQKDALTCILFLSKYDKTRAKIPSFLDKSYIPIMFNLLKSLLNYE